MPPDAQQKGASVAGTISTIVGTNLAGTIEFDTRLSQPANWLENDGLQAYMITWSSDTPTLLVKQENDRVQAHIITWSSDTRMLPLNDSQGDETNITLQIDLREGSTDSGSLWPSYLAPAKL